MPYLPNEASVATYPRQAVPMSADIDNIVFAHMGYGVIEGLAVTAGTGLSVSIAAGTVARKEIFAAIAASANLALTTADATNPRLDAVVVSSAGTITVRTGTAAASPVPVDLTTNDVLLALVYVPNSAASVTATNIRDKRVYIEPHGLVYLANPATNYTTTQTAVVAATGLTVPANYVSAGNHFRLRMWGVYTSVAAPGNLTVRGLYGATVLATTGAVALTASQTAKSILVEMDVSVISTTAFEAQGTLLIGTSATASALWPLGASVGTQNTANVTVATTTAQNLTFDFTLSVAQTAFRWRTLTIEMF
jgi:hypothetical protein